MPIKKENLLMCDLTSAQRRLYKTFVSQFSNDGKYNINMLCTVVFNII